MGRRSYTHETPQQRIERLLRSAGHRSQPLPAPSAACDGKVKYTKRLATIVARDRSQISPGIEPYACPWCRAWHIGHRRHVQ